MKSGPEMSEDENRGAALNNSMYKIKSNLILAM